MHLLKTTPADCTLGDRVLCVQLHGDAAFSGQGIVSESLSLSGLPHFGSGGTIHLIVNNNIGYTTPATLARSSVYASDAGKMIGCPILHVNGDYPEDVIRAIDVAMKYRGMFRKDIILDLICYRRWGHNELDEPGFTQPKMYKVVRGRQSVPDMYEGRLVKEGVITEQEGKEWRKGYTEWLEGCLNGVDGWKAKSEMLQGKWGDMVWPAGEKAIHEPKTGVSSDQLKEVAEASVTLPESFVSFRFPPCFSHQSVANLKAECPPQTESTYLG
jgi:probable 2-oxoglutarate dehydrogenase E1 component DHKTD1